MRPPFPEILFLYLLCKFFPNHRLFARKRRSMCSKNRCCPALDKNRETVSGEVVAGAWPAENPHGINGECSSVRPGNGFGPIYPVESKSDVTLTSFRKRDVGIAFIACYLLSCSVRLFFIQFHLYLPIIHDSASVAIRTAGWLYAVSFPQSDIVPELFCCETVMAGITK